MRRVLLASLLILSPTLGQANEMPKAAWIANMETAMPAHFCKSDSPFRECFRVEAAECEEVAASVTRICLDKHAGQIPDPVRLPQQGRQWGTAVGACAGQTYVSTLADKRIITEDCNRKLMGG